MIRHITIITSALMLLASHASAEPVKLRCEWKHPTKGFEKEFLMFVDNEHKWMRTSLSSTNISAVINQDTILFNDDYIINFQYNLSEEEGIYGATIVHFDRFTGEALVKKQEIHDFKYVKREWELDARTHPQPIYKCSTKKV